MINTVVQQSQATVTLSGSFFKKVITETGKSFFRKKGKVICKANPYKVHQKSNDLALKLIGDGQFSLDDIESDGDVISYTGKIGKILVPSDIPYTTNARVVINSSNEMHWLYLSRDEEFIFHYHKCMNDGLFQRNDFNLKIYGGISSLKKMFNSIIENSSDA